LSWDIKASLLASSKRASLVATPPIASCALFNPAAAADAPYVNMCDNVLYQIGE
jgi:hypothetical protein